MNTFLVYRKSYNIHIPFAKYIHPFDGRKFEKAFREIKKFLPAIEKSLHIPPTINEEAINRFLSPEYAEMLKNPKYVCQALEVPFLQILPDFLLRPLIFGRIVKPMKWATTGTILATELALDGNIVFNLGGGYHHAGKDRGEGFCLYNDIGIAVNEMQIKGRLQSNDPIGIIDTDAHHGNGNVWVFQENPAVRILDMYNKQIYPIRPGLLTPSHLDYPVPLASETEDEEYLEKLEKMLAEYMIAVPYRIIFYNAGTDTYFKDKLGNMKMTAEGIFKRDLLVFEYALKYKIPVVMLTSGGYHTESYKMVADTVIAVFRQQKL